MITKFKQYNIEKIPEYIENPEFDIKIAKAILMSLVKRNLISPQQNKDCIENWKRIIS